MMGDLKKRASFARLVNYVNNQKKARVIDSKDVRLDSNATIAASMQGQADDKPGRRLKNPVYHISLDFAHEDTPKLTDGLMAKIAREYMRRMGIVNTQYIVSRHTDTEHQHLHIVANRVDNDGNTISDRNDAVRNVAVCKALTREYGLHFSKGKVNVKRERLRGKDKVKYQIHDAVKAALPRCGSWSELCDRLAKQGIGTSFKFDRRNGKIIGVSFTKDGVSFSGSRIDRGMGFYKLDKQLGGRIIGDVEWRNNLYGENHIRPTNEHRADRKASTYESERPFGQATKSISTDEQASPSDNGTFTDANADAAIVRTSIGVLVELCVQPHQAKVSSGGGGGGNDNGWGDSDKEKDKLKPRRRRR